MTTTETIEITETSGPRYCATCGTWPAMETPLGPRCHLCECRDYAAAHPVPLPDNPEMLRDLARVGVPGAAEKLSRAPNDTPRHGDECDCGGCVRWNESKEFNGCVLQCDECHTVFGMPKT